MNSLTNETMIGHNAAGVLVSCEVRLFNTISRFAGVAGAVRHLTLPAGTDLAALLRELQVPPSEVFLIFVNGRDISPDLRRLRTHYVIEDGDVIALSGPVPYSWAYGAPVV